MFYFLLICVSFLGCLSAENIKNVEYQIPSTESWKLVKELQNDKSSTLIYIPANHAEDDTGEFFSVHANYFKNTTFDASSLEKALMPQFPGKNVKITVIEADPQTMLFECIVGEEESFGLTRFISSDQGTVTLIYRTENKTTYENKHAEMIEVLKAAKFDK